MKTEINVKKIEKDSKVYYILEIWFVYKSNKKYKAYSTFINKLDYERYIDILSK